ncbi:MAG: DUF6600 domain-containing protein [Candidatus Aminicenantales bacterium]
MKKVAIILLALLFALSLLLAEETPYTNYSFARLSYVSGKTFIQRASELGFEEGVVNMPIAEGDRLGTTEGRAEVYLGKRNYVWLDNQTKIDFLNLPKKGSDLSRFRIWSGNVCFSIQFLEKEKNFEIHTTDVSIYVLEKGLYRIDVRENRETEIFVFEGLLEAAGEEGSVLLSSEKRLEVVNGRFTSRPSQFYAVAQDSFDRWCEYRETELRKRVAKKRLPDELADFEAELAEYGEWVYLRPYGWVWVPSTQDSDWRPYYYGRWTWLPLCGWTWIPFEPWGWAPFHYGRWQWGIGLGWYWIPTPFWGPAWVSWWWDYYYWGWVPLGYYGYPIVVIGDVFYPWYYGRRYPYNNRALTVIRKGQMQVSDVSKVALRQVELKKLGEITLTRKAPLVKPDSPELELRKLKDNRFILKKETGRSEIKERGGTKRIIRELRNIEGREIKKKNLEKKEPLRKVIKDAGKKKIKKEEKSSTEKKIIKKKKYIKGGIVGYPPSPQISRKNLPSRKLRKSRSIISRMYDYITGSSQGRYLGRRSSSGRSSPATLRRGSSSRGSSVSRGRSSTTGRSAGTRSGTIRKKK